MSDEEITKDDRKPFEYVILHDEGGDWQGVYSYTDGSLVVEGSPYENFGSPKQYTKLLKNRVIPHHIVKWFEYFPASEDDEVPETLAAVNFDLLSRIHIDTAE